MSYFPAEVYMPESNPKILLEMDKTLKKKKKSTSKVWDYFRTHPNTKESVCLTCALKQDATIESTSCYKKGSSTYNLKYHLKVEHQIEIAEDEQKLIGKEENSIQSQLNVKVS